MDHAIDHDVPHGDEVREAFGSVRSDLDGPAVVQEGLLFGGCEGD